MHGTLPKLPAKPPAQLRARERRALPRRPVTHIALPGYEVARVEPRRRETITALLKRTGWARREEGHWRFRNGLPTILTVNGEAVLRKRWRHTRIGLDDVVQFVSRPLGGQQGGGNTGKQVIGLVALIAVVAFAAFVTGGGAAALGSAFAKGAWGAYALGAAIGIGGSLLINTLINPKPGATNDPNAKTDQIYTASATGNLPKLGQPLPVGYGREKVFPDFAATPWSEFVGNDQYQNILLSVGLGKYSYEQLYIDDTPFWDPVNGVAAAFSSAQIEFYDPGEQVTLFPASVSSSAEVTGQQLPHGGGITGLGETAPGAWLGGYAANPAGTVTQSIAIDFVLPAGCYYIHYQQTTTSPLSIGLRAEYRAINDAGAPTGSWTELFDVVKTYHNRSPIRDSIKVDVPDGRYEVRFRRNDDVPADSNGASDVVWAGLRTFIKGNNSFPVSTIAIRIKGTESTQGSFKFGAVRTRILPVWNGSAFVEQPTRNNAWAFFDAVTNEEYGSGHPISKSDFNAVVAHAAGCDARGDHFDYTFSSATSVPEALDKILMPSRARHFWLGDVISLVRDEWRDVPSMLLTDREIVRDSTQISWSMLGEEDPDAVIVEYVDEETWRPAQVQYPPEVAGIGGFHATNAETKRIDGIVNRAHAYREAAFLFLQSYYRRENVQIATEYEGRAITFGSVLRVQSELPMAYGYGGAVVDRTGNALTLDPAPSWADAGNHYIRLRRPNGKWFGPVLVTRGASDAIATLDDGQLATAVSTQGVTLSDVLAREDGGEDPSFDFGTADNQSRLCVVLSGQPNGNQCTLNLVVDDPRVHATDLGNPPAIPTGQFPTNQTAPLIAGLNATFDQGVTEPKLSASWAPATGAIYYVAEVTYDSGASWQQVYEGRDNQFSVVVQLAALTLRVQAVATLHGPYSEISLGAPTIEWKGAPIGLAGLQEGVRLELTTIISGINEALNTELTKIAALSANAIATGFKDKQGLRDQTNSIRESLELSLGEAKASIEEVRTVAVGAAGAVATLETSVAAQFESALASITTLQNAIATVDGSLTEYKTTVAAQFGAVNSSISTNATAIATLNTSFSNYQTTVSATLGNLQSSVTTNANAIATLNTSIGNLQTSVNASVGSKAAVTISIGSPAIVSETAHGLSSGTPFVLTTTGALPTGLTAGTTYYVVNPTTNAYQVALANGVPIITSGTQSGVHTRATGLNASVSTNTTAIATLYGYAAASYTLSLDVNGYVSGLQLANGGPGQSFFCVIADKFLVAQPGTAGGSFVPVFTVSSVNGVAKLALRGDMTIDGSINTTQLAVGGVDFNAILDGAVSNNQASSGTTGSGTEATISSHTINVKSGRLFISANLNTVTEAVIRGSIYVDGVLKASGASFPPFDQTGISHPPTPISLQTFVQGLSDGNHTVELKGSISTGTLIGSIVSINLRK